MRATSGDRTPVRLNLSHYRSVEIEPLPRNVAIVVLVLFGAMSGSLIAILLGSEQIVVIHSMSTLDATYGSSTPVTAPPSLLLVGLGALAGAAVAALLVRSLLRR
jgi:hypothetical protein